MDEKLTGLSGSARSWQMVPSGISWRSVIGLMLFYALLSDGDDWTAHAGKPVCGQHLMGRSSQ